MKHKNRPRGYKTGVQSQTQNKAQWLAACGHVSASSQSLRFILSLRMNSSFITSMPGVSLHTSRKSSLLVFDVVKYSTPNFTTNVSLVGDVAFILIISLSSCRFLRLLEYWRSFAGCAMSYNVNRLICPSKVFHPLFKPLTKYFRTVPHLCCYMHFFFTSFMT